MAGAAAALALATAACGSSAPDAPAQHSEPPQSRPVLGLMSTLPIYWPEGGAFAALGESKAPPHWARAALERAWRLQPLDSLDADGLKGLGLLVLAQPRMLSGPENVALDDWVRGGGHLLVFADPLLSGESVYPLGDPRRPQDVALLDPILARWGLDLQPPEHDPRVKNVTVGSATIPVAGGGRFALRPPAGGGEAGCELSAQGLLADCVIGRGRVVALADATLLEAGFETSGSPRSLAALVGMAREQVGEHAGRPGE